MRHAVQQRGQMAGQVRIPGVRVHQVGGGDRGGHREIGGDRPQRRVGAIEPVPWPVCHRAGPVRALAVHGQVHQLGQLAGEVADVHTRAAVHLGRVLPGEQRHPELGHRGTSWPLPTTVMPPADTTKPRARSRSLSTPTLARSGTTTFLSMIASRTTAWRPMTVSSRMTDRSTVAQLLTRTPGESTELRTSPPDTMTPLLTRLSSARPTRSPESCTNFAGGWEGTWVRIGQRSLYRLKTGVAAHRSMWASK